MKREDLEERPYCTIIASSDFPFYAAPEADAVMDAMESRIKELEADNARLKTENAELIERAKWNARQQREHNDRTREENERLKATISKMENVDERREYAYEMDIVIRWLDKNEDFVTEPNGKMQLLKSKAMFQKLKWLDEHPRTTTTEDSSETEKDG